RAGQGPHPGRSRCLRLRRPGPGSADTLLRRHRAVREAAPVTADGARMSEHVDVLIVGAGLSGIGAAHHIQAAFPGKTYAILEARDAIGGTWDLFRYPGVRSDSDMYTLGYRFRPWTQAEAIADGPSILGYVRDTAAEAAIDRQRCDRGDARPGHGADRGPCDDAAALAQLHPDAPHRGRHRQPAADAAW